MMLIPLTQGQFTMVDDEDFDALSQRKWYFCKGYAVSNGKRNGKEKRSPDTYMHRLLNKTPDDFETDHINGDKLDNRKVNLRSVTTSQNQMNKKSENGSTSKYKGVFWDKQNNKWRAQLIKNGEKFYLGLFSTEKEAAIAYNKKAIDLFFEFAKLNNI